MVVHQGQKKVIEVPGIKAEDLEEPVIFSSSESRKRTGTIH